MTSLRAPCPWAERAGPPAVAPVRGPLADGGQRSRLGLSRPGPGRDSPVISEASVGGCKARSRRSGAGAIATAPPARRRPDAGCQPASVSDRSDSPRTCIGLMLPPFRCWSPSSPVAVRAPSVVARCRFRAERQARLHALTGYCVYGGRRRAGGPRGSGMEWPTKEGGRDLPPMVHLRDRQAPVLNMTRRRAQGGASWQFRSAHLKTCRFSGEPNPAATRNSVVSLSLLVVW